MISSRLDPPILLTLIILTSVSCSEKEITKKWSNSLQPLHFSSVETSSTPSNLELSKPIVFMFYNLKNYNVEKKKRSNIKTERLRAETTEIIADISPDILAVCEIGGNKSLEEFQSRLESHNLHFPHAAITFGCDPSRQIALLSKYPITKNSGHIEYYYSNQKQKQLMRRGILDVTVHHPSIDLRTIGVHLKSKRSCKYSNQAFIREQESTLVQNHTKEILSLNSTTPLLLYGDFNDTKDSPAVAAFNPFLNMIHLEDPQGSTWTHYWKSRDQYSRIDFIFCSRNIFKLVDFHNTGILPTIPSYKNSDHRPLFIRLGLN